MRRSFPLALVLIAVMAPADASPAPGGSGLLSPTPVVPIGSRTPSAPIKDCTRFNGRSGYYGNFWCSEREQLIWDRYSSGRRSGRR